MICCTNQPMSRLVHLRPHPPNHLIQSLFLSQSQNFIPVGRTLWEPNQFRPAIHQGSNKPVVPRIIISLSHFLSRERLKFSPAHLRLGESSLSDSLQSLQE